MEPKFNSNSQEVPPTHSTYDKMAEGYLTPDRRSTTALFREIQRGPLRKYLHVAQQRIGYYSDMKYLVVGPGPEANADELLSLHQIVGPYLDVIDPNNVTYLDNSAVTLDLAQKHVKQEVEQLYTTSKAGVFVEGDAETASTTQEENSQDIIFAALCDHLEQGNFFESSMRVLKPGGALITSYPADGINRVAREQIYGINVEHTRFTIDGSDHLVPSHLMTAESLRRLYEIHNYTNIQTLEISSGTAGISKTIDQAAKLAGMNATSSPLIVVGIGFKKE